MYNRRYNNKNDMEQIKFMEMCQNRYNGINF